ncbi:MAG: SMC-Scp complex subunit ScpB [Atopobiaceae bacterium]|nr:SMC-Scp complex subunit ScpB [Atopobiaceae bacterium]
MRDVTPLDQGSLMGVLESLLLVSADAVPARDLAQAAGVEEEQATEALEALSANYADANRGIQLREVAGGWRLFTHPAYHDQVEAFVLSWDKRRLSQAALETLAVIAYHQPVSREGVRAVRGVNSDGVIASLRQKGLVREVGKDARQAALFGTTVKFLESFGLRSVGDLPPLEEFAPDEESRRFIQERLSGRSMEVSLEEASEDLDEEQELLDSVSEDDAGETGTSEPGLGESNADESVAEEPGASLGEEGTEDE